MSGFFNELTDAELAEAFDFAKRAEEYAQQRHGHSNLRSDIGEIQERVIRRQAIEQEIERRQKSADRRNMIGDGLGAIAVFIIPAAFFVATSGFGG